MAVRRIIVEGDSADECVLTYRVLPMVRDGSMCALHPPGKNPEGRWSMEIVPSMRSPLPGWCAEP